MHNQHTEFKSEIKVKLTYREDIKMGEMTLQEGNKNTDI